MVIIGPAEEPYAGSGSAGEACQMTHRRFLLGDLDPRLVRLAFRRLGLSCAGEEEEPEEPSADPAPLDLPSFATGMPASRTRRRSLGAHQKEPGARGAA
jgi:hypothetical protein